MGIRDRDCMKRPSDDDGSWRGERSKSTPAQNLSESKAEELARKFFQKHPRFFVFCISLGILIIIVLVVAHNSNAKR